MTGLWKMMIRLRAPAMSRICFAHSRAGARRTSDPATTGTERLARVTNAGAGGGRAQRHTGPRAAKRQKVLCNFGGVRLLPPRVDLRGLEKR